VRIHHIATVEDWERAWQSGAYTNSTGTDTFPHIYGPLDPGAVVDVRPIDGDTDLTPQR